MDGYIYQKARDLASKKNKSFCSREGAAKALGVSSTSLSNYETDFSIPPPEVVTKMAEVYNTPELRHYYCRRICKMKAPFIPEISTDLTATDVEGLTLKLLKALKVVPELRESLVDIAEDGIIDENERAPFNTILDELTEIIKHASELQAWAEKIMKL